MTFDHIRNFERFTDLADWTGLNNQLPGKLRIGDIDGILERNGRLLIIESKSTMTATLSFGQRLMLENMCKAGYATILVLYENNIVGFEDEHVKGLYRKMEIMKPDGEGWRKQGLPNDKALSDTVIGRVINEWLDYAKNNPLVSRGV
jgi:hypothetical protein